MRVFTGWEIVDRVKSSSDSGSRRLVVTKIRSATVQSYTGTHVVDVLHSDGTEKKNYNNHTLVYGYCYSRDIVCVGCRVI